MSNKSIHVIGIGGAGNLLIADIKEQFGYKFEYSVVRKQDYGTIFPEIESYIPKSKRLNYYDKKSIPEGFFRDYDNQNMKYVLVTGLGGVFSSYFIQKLNESFKLKQFDFYNLVIEPLRLEGTAINRSKEAISNIEKITDTHSINLEEIKMKYDGKITFNELFEITKNEAINIIKTLSHE